MKYAVIESGGKQYKVSEGDVIEVDKVSGEKDQKIIFDKVLLLVADGAVLIGKPILPDVKVEGTILEQKKGEKIRVAKFKAKSRHRRVMGFRSQLTSIKIEKIESEVKKTSSPKKTSKAKPR